ncbi:carbon-nitrogen hydrolase family protein [[Eubacterium] cellulosolvens]
MKRINIALAQIATKIGDKSYNLKIIENICSAARKKNTELVIFPELSVTGYLCRDAFYQLAEQLDGPSVSCVKKIAKENNMLIIFGMPIIGKIKNVIYNSSVIVSQDGETYSYDKLYLPTHSVFDEKRYFRSGNKVDSFDIKGLNIGMSICYDLYFPEIYRIFAIKGAELVICISASPSTRKEYFETLIKARAIENGIFMVLVNRVGIEDGLTFWGGSQIVGPNGDVISKGSYYDNETVYANIDLGKLDRTRPFIPTLKDLRPEIIDELSNSYHNF